MWRFVACLTLAVACPAAGQVRWNAALSQRPTWYASEEARTLAVSVLSWQDNSGGWPKNLDFAQHRKSLPTPPREADLAPTIDNGGTTTPLRYLARVASAQPALADVRRAVDRGLDYLLAAQYESGGWPQFYPLKPGYYSQITYNDNAMVNVLTLLREVADGLAPFEFVDRERRQKAGAAAERGIACILRTQVRQDGRLTAWCAQHDVKTFAPVWARNFEPPSLSANESAGIVRFLMGVPSPSREIRAAVDGAVCWLDAVKIAGLRVENFTGDDGKRDRRAVADPAAKPIWARFYELGTNRPIFVGRDKVVRYDFNEIERERRVGYAYLGDWPAKLLQDDYPRWRAKHADVAK